MSEVTEADSLDILRKTIPCLALKCSSQPVHMQMQCVPVNALAFICRKGPEMGTFKLCACLNQIRRASSTSECAAVRSLFRYGAKLDDSYASRVFSLFFMIEEIVLLTTPNSPPIEDFCFQPLL